MDYDITASPRLHWSHVVTFSVGGVWSCYCVSLTLCFEDYWRYR